MEDSVNQSGWSGCLRGGESALTGELPERPDIGRCASRPGQPLSPLVALYGKALGFHRDGIVTEQRREMRVGGREI